MVEIISGEIGSWKETNISRIFSSQEANIILSLPISKVGVKDNGLEIYKGWKILS